MCCVPDRSPGEMSDEDEAREYQDFSDEDVSDVEALPGDDDRPARSHKLHEARPTFASRVSYEIFLSDSQQGPRIFSIMLKKSVDQVKQTWTRVRQT